MKPIINETFLVSGPILPEKICEVVQSASASNIGAHSLFLGQVRADLVEGQLVKAIEYSAYEVMVQAEMKKILTLVSDKYKDLKIVNVFHSTGLVKAGEISLLVFVACGHRKESFRAVEDIVEMIKEKIPVWKKEILENDNYNWPDNRCK